MKRDNRLSWFPFFPEAWLAECSLKGLSIPAQGVLIRLACVQWLEEDIPSDLVDLTKKLGGYTGEGVAEVLRLFVHRQGKVGKLYWPRLESIKQGCILRSRKLSDAGKKGARKRYQKQAEIPEDENTLARS